MQIYLVVECMYVYSYLNNVQSSSSGYECAWWAWVCVHVVVQQSELIWHEVMIRSQQVQVHWLPHHWRLKSLPSPTKITLCVNSPDQHIRDILSSRENSRWPTFSQSCWYLMNILNHSCIQLFFFLATDHCKPFDSLGSPHYHCIIVPLDGPCVELLQPL